MGAHVRGRRSASDREAPDQVRGVCEIRGRRVGDVERVAKS